jgi:hypothetical protein
MLTAREAALIAWSAFLCVSASFLRSACVRPPPPPSAQKMQKRSEGDLALAQKTCWWKRYGRYTGDREEIDLALAQNTCWKIHGRYTGDTGEIQGR